MPPMDVVLHRFFQISWSDIVPGYLAYIHRPCFSQRERIWFGHWQLRKLTTWKCLPNMAKLFRKLIFWIFDMGMAHPTSCFFSAWAHLVWSLDTRTQHMNRQRGNEWFREDTNIQKLSLSRRLYRSQLFIRLSHISFNTASLVLHISSSNVGLVIEILI